MRHGEKLPDIVCAKGPEITDLGAVGVLHFDGLPLGHLDGDTAAGGNAILRFECRCAVRRNRAVERVITAVWL